LKRALPLWLAAVVPATLAGHALAYALSGRSAADGHHAWMAPALECSLALLFAICSALLGTALLKAGILMHTAAERSWIALWPRLAVVQLALFIVMERAEGAHAGTFGCIMQILTALLAAYVLNLFARLLACCVKSTVAVSRYLERALHTVTSFVSRRPAPAAYALAVRAGRARFQRPPPR
jgi:hypothetical protein